MLCFSPPIFSSSCPPHPLTPPHPPFRKPQHEQRKEQEPKRPHIKKPLNAFMLYMKEMRANVVAECTLKESAAINQILGRRVSGGVVGECSWSHELLRSDLPSVHPCRGHRRCNRQLLGE